MFMLTIKRKVTFHKIYHRPQGEFNIGVWVTNPKASEFGLKAHSELTSLCMVDVHEKNSTTLPEVPAWMNWNEALTLTLNFPMCLSDAPLEGLLPSSWCVFEAQNKKKQLKIVTKWSKLTGTISITQKQVLLPETNMPAWVSLGSTWMGGGITIEVTTAVDYSLPSWQAIKNSTVVVVFFLFRTVRHTSTKSQDHAGFGCMWRPQRSMFIGKSVYLGLGSSAFLEIIGEATPR